MPTKRLLVVTAHPDDESVGPGGTIAYYAARHNYEVHLTCVTDGAAATFNPSKKMKMSKDKLQQNLVEIRSQELINAAIILGISSTEQLGFKDGTLCNLDYPILTNILLKRMNSIKPHVIITHDQNGGSGHLDHIAVSMMTTYAFLQSAFPRKLFYHARLRDSLGGEDIQNYFVYVPKGRTIEEISATIDYRKFDSVKQNAIQQHQSQLEDLQKYLCHWGDARRDYYIEQYSRVKNVPRGCLDLFSGIDNDRD